MGERERPWHRALIEERAGRFYLAYGLECAGYELLARARAGYLEWGASAKVAQLDWAYPPARATPGALDESAAVGERPDRHFTVTTGTIDLLGILSASQALSSETNLERLHARVVEVLSALTGATGVHLLLSSGDRQDWLLPAPHSDAGSAPVGGTGQEHAVPMSVLRYAQRMREPLVVNDATHDDRFARDPYFADLDCCALLAVPIISRGTLRAVLVLENRLIRGAFSSERLDTVKLIAGQLAVSLDNTQLYADYRRVADEQAALRRVATLVARGVAPAEIFDAVTREAGLQCDADLARMERFEPDGTVTGIAAWSRSDEVRLAVDTRFDPEGGSIAAQVLETGRPARVDSYEGASGPMAREAQALGVRSSVGCPIVVGGRTWGVIAASTRREARFPPDTESGIADFTELVATAVLNAESQDQLAASRARLVTEADAARGRIVRDLHDGAQQRLVHTSITLDLAQRELEQDMGAAQALIAEAVEHARQANEALRELTHGILPVDLARGGLRGGIDAVVKRLDLAVKVDVPPERFPAEIEASAYFIVAEALTNIVKHAHAQSAAVSALIDDGMLQVEIRDDGIGGADPSGHGLLGINDRVTALGGQFSIESPASGGTVLTARMPSSAAPANAT